MSNINILPYISYDDTFEITEQGLKWTSSKTIEKREEILIAMANKSAQKAIKFNKNVILEAMNSYERRIIHTELVNSQTVTTKSQGKEPNRRHFYAHHQRFPGGGKPPQKCYPPSPSGHLQDLLGHDRGRSVLKV